MREQDIRQILKEVCDALDRQRATAGHIAIGVAIAIGTAGCETEPRPLYALPTNVTVPTDASTTSTNVVTDAAPATEAATSSDTGSMQPPMVVKYGAPDPTFVAPPPTTTTQVGPVMTAKYMAVFDAGPVHKYGMPPTPPDSMAPPVARYGVPPTTP